MGIGPECRKNGQKRRATRIFRSLQFNDHQPINFKVSHKSDVEYSWNGHTWTNGKTEITDDDFGWWLKRYGFVDKETLRQGSHPSAVKEETP
jgi:hypothetical protein